MANETCLELMAQSRWEAVIKRSRFIGTALPVSDEAQALQALEELRGRYAGATHNCYAYRVGHKPVRERFSDAGEPSGTAGLPILNVAKSAGVTNVIIVVTRYFGGVLLGAAGLARAYAAAASGCIEGAALCRIEEHALFRADLSFKAWARLESFIRKAAQVERVEFTDGVRVEFSASPDEAPALVSRMLELTGGAARIADLGVKAVKTPVCGD